MDAAVWADASLRLYMRPIWVDIRLVEDHRPNYRKILSIEYSILDFKQVKTLANASGAEVNEGRASGRVKSHIVRMRENEAGSTHTVSKASVFEWY
ncbi:hypothetical protein MPER_09606 [Moniliophthora perniciosa FA553]|nr:hypothetical protein MPER_09606 [Moniliophthora perniciosa FA553]